MFTESLDPHGPVASPLGDIGVGDHDGRATDAGHDDLEHVQRIGDHWTGQHIIDGERLVLPDGAVGVVGVEPLIYHDLGHRALVVAVYRAVALSDLPVWAVLAEVAVGDVEFGLRRTVLIARRAEEHGVDQLLGFLLRHLGDVASGQRAEHDIAQPQLDGRGRAPHHPGGTGAAEVQ